MRKRLAVVAMGLLLGFAAVRSGANGDEKKIVGTIVVAKGTKEAAFPGMAKLGFSEALALALKKVPGKVLSAELEDEDGFLIYSVDIVGSDLSITGAEVDAGSGAVLSVEKDEEEAKSGKDESKGGDKEDEDDEEGED